MGKLLERLAGRFGFVPRETVQRALVAHGAAARTFRRSFEAGQVSRLSEDFVPSHTSIDSELIARLRLMRVRSRYLFRNEPYARRFARVMQKNVVGQAGVQLTIKTGTGGLTKEDATLIQDRWKAWGSSRFASVDGRTSWRQLQRLALGGAVTDGEAFQRIVLSPSNPYLVSLQPFVPSQFDEQFNSNGAASQIRLAVETRLGTGERLAYWPWAVDPGDVYSSRRGMTRLQIPAGEMVHWFIPEETGQSRGVPWLFAAIPQLNMLNGYAEAELVAARVSASKMGFIVPPEGGEYTGDGTDPEGNTITEASPGQFEELPPGSDLKQFDPQHPNANFSDFQKAMMRGVAAAGDVSYHTLSGDLESVNYSSARIGLLDERDGYELIQDEFIAGYCSPIFRTWLVAQAALGAIPLSVEEAARFEAFTWRPRRWPWVDPQKDLAAAAAAVGLRIRSRTEICAEQGRDFEPVAEELAQEAELLESLGLTPEPAMPGAAATPGNEPKEEKPKAGRNGRSLFSVLRTH